MPGADVAAWGDCGTCPDCFLGAFNYRPKSAVQYILALTSFDRPAAGEPERSEGDARARGRAEGEPERSEGGARARGRAAGEPLRFRFGFIASSDNHSARPGTGYKEFARLAHTEARGARDAKWLARFLPQTTLPPTPQSVPFDPERTRLANFQVLDFERQASFFLTGGLVATHARGRSREAVWDALARREVYGTSGERMLLWFDLLNGPEGRALPMGSETHLRETPRFRVRAAGGFEQLPGCPQVSTQGLSAERLEHLCRGECYHPGNARRPIARIEVVRIRPRVRPDEPIGALVQDPWRVIPCPDDEAGCTADFEDPDFLAENREVLYYVRAVQAPTPAVNADLLRCQKRDATGQCLEVEPCYGDYRTPAGDDCLAPAAERAWSSPIWVGQ